MKIFVTLVLFATFCPSSQAMNLGESRADVRSLITDAQATRQRFTNAELNSWINEGQRIADAKTWCTYKAVTFRVTMGTTYYALPDDFIQVSRVTRDFLSLPEMTPAGLDGRSAEWENMSGLPTYYFINFSSRTKIGFAPFPMTSSDEANIKVEYVGFSSPLVNDSDNIFSGISEFAPYSFAVAYYSAYKASIVDERNDKAKIFLDSFTSLTTLMKDQCTQRMNYRPQMVGKQ